MTQNKVFKLADIRKLNKQVAFGEISSMKMVETLNNMAYEWHTYKLQAKLDRFKNSPSKDKPKEEIDLYIARKEMNNSWWKLDMTISAYNLWVEKQQKKITNKYK